MASSLETLTVNTPDKGNIIKAKSVAVFCAPMTVSVPTVITQGGTAGPPAVPITLKELTGFLPIGLLRKDDAVPRSRDRDVSDVMAVGYDDPVRSDVTADAMSCKIVALETRKTTIEKFLNVDLSGITPDPATGEVSFPQINTGLLPPARWLFLGQDGTALNRTWFGWCFTSGVVSETDDQTMGGTDDPWMWPMTIKSQTDTALGFGVYHYNAGPGWKSRLQSMGFAVS